VIVPAVSASPEEILNSAKRILRSSDFRGVAVDIQTTGPNVTLAVKETGLRRGDGGY